MRVTINQIRMVCNDSDRKGIHVKSTLDNTYKLDGKTDESIAWADDDLIAIKNVTERPIEILLESIRLPEGRIAILRPSRQGFKKLFSKEVSSVNCECDLTLGPGETCMLHSSEWMSRTSGGARFPV